MVLNKVNKSLVSLIEELGVKACGVSGKDGGMLKVEKKYSKEIHKCKINITLYEIEDSNVPKCVAKFKYGNIEYMLMGTMSEQNFEKILKNLFFPK